MSAIEIENIGAAKLESSRATPMGFSQCLEETEAVLDQISNPLFLTSDDWSDNCPGFPDSSSLQCDFEKFKGYDNKECREKGGKIIPITIEMCSVNIFVADADGSGNGSIQFVEKILIENFPQCSGISCNEREISKVIDGDNKLYGASCPKEGQFNKFALRAKAGEVVVRTCKWLGKKPEAMKEKICARKKFQVYAQGNLPASRMCPITCEPYGCVEEKENVRFLYDAVVNDNGNLEPAFRNCRFLSRLEGDELQNVCWPNNKNLAYLDSKYGFGWEVCTTSCPFTCKK